MSWIKSIKKWEAHSSDPRKTTLNRNPLILTNHDQNANMYIKLNQSVYKPLGTPEWLTIAVGSPVGSDIRALNHPGPPSPDQPPWTNHPPGISQGEYTQWRVGGAGLAASVETRQRNSCILSIYHPISPPFCSPVYLSIPLYPANIGSLGHSLCSLEWQFNLHSGCHTRVWRGTEHLISSDCLLHWQLLYKWTKCKPEYGKNINDLFMC